MIKDLQQSVANQAPLPPPPLRSQTINELKSTLMGQLVIDGSPEDVDLVQALQRQAAIQKAAYDVQRDALEEDRRRN